MRLRSVVLINTADCYVLSEEMTMEKLATGKETNRIEFKRELNDKLERWLSAFLTIRRAGNIYRG